MRIALINITVLAIAVPCIYNSQVTKIAISLQIIIILDAGINFATIGHEL